MTPEAASAAVLAAFDGVRRPLEAEIAPHDCDECARLRRILAQQTWAGMPGELLERIETKLPLLSPEAYAFFLPAWLLYALDHPTATGPTEFLVYDLAPGEGRGEAHEAWWRERLRPLTAEQVAAGDAVLAVLAANPENERYFGPFAPGRERYRQRWRERWNE